MLTKTFLTHLLPARIAEALRRVQNQIWQPVSVTISVTQTQSFRKHRRASELSAADFSPVPSESFHWGPKYAQRWFKLRLPESMAGDRTWYLSWEDQAEATVYVEGVPYSGLDVAHRRCPLPAGIAEVLVECACVRTGIWIPDSGPALDEEGSRYSPPRLWTRDDVAWGVYHDLKVLLDVLDAEHRDWQPPQPGPTPKAMTDPVRFTPPAFRASPLFRRWCARLDEAIDVFDQHGLEAFATELRALYAAHPAERESLRAVLTGHAHIDLVWLWPERVGEFKAVHTWATQARLLEAYPEFRFGYSQPASYEAVERRAPVLHARVKELIAAGRWEATGASYVESDTQMPCGEALLRSLRLGQEAFIRLRGTPASVFWLPDVFGYSGCLPQLLSGLGVRGFFTTKLAWSVVNRFPHSSFRWRGPDGAEVVAQIELINGYNETLDAKRLRESALHHQQAAVHPEFLVPAGYGDGGGGTTEEMCERARRMSDLAGVPRTEWGSIEGFFERLSRVREQLPAVTGELMLEMHRGVFTTHGRLKAAFRGLERALQIQEAAHAAVGEGPVDAQAWRRLVFSQFHDYIPGSSIWEVYSEGIVELERLAEKALSETKAVLSRQDHGASQKASMRKARAREALIVANGEVVCEGSDAEAKTGAYQKNGSERGWFNPLPVARSWTDGERCLRLPPLSGGPVASLATVDAPPPVATASSLAGTRVQAEFSPSGGLSRLLVDGYEVALAGGGGHVLRAYRDQPAAFDAWDIDRNSLVVGVDATPDGAPVIEGNGVTASVAFPMRIAKESRITVRYRVVADEPVLRIEYDVDWRDPAMCLKAIFNTRYLGQMARFGAPYGSVCRGQWPGYNREEAQWEVPGSRWLILSDDSQSEGFALVTEAKYGFTVRDGAVGVSLLRSALVTEADLHPALRDEPNRPRYSDLERQSIRLAVGRFASDLPAESQPAVLADTLFTPCVAYAGSPKGTGLLGVDGAPSLVPAWAEPLADGRWLLRLHETLGRRGVAMVRLMPGWSACETVLGYPIFGDKDETPCWMEDELSLAYEPYKVCSVILSRELRPVRGAG
ncbi:alpha-mannosidase [Opitutaceae bacterium TAV4]|nr:alpha-mannosidase [Opitutaceae bacterium TAV4]RRK00976.1 alpha-mannosidase [Opitutaceae bacterium TAV3]